MKEGSLDALLPSAWHMHLLKCERISVREIHRGRSGHGCGGEILYLFGIQAFFLQVLGKRDHILNSAARVPGHQIREEEDTGTTLLAGCLESLSKRLEDRFSRFVHAGSHLVHDMLGCNFHVTGDMVRDDLREIRLGIPEHQIMANP